jgi:hypothetical protein
VIVPKMAGAQEGASPPFGLQYAWEVGSSGLGASRCRPQFREIPSWIFEVERLLGEGDLLERGPARKERPFPSAYNMLGR